VLTFALGVVEQQTMTSHQSDYQNEASLDDIFNTDVADQPNLQVLIMFG